MTHVIPVVDGYVLAGAVRSMPLAGRDVTNFVQQMLRYEGGGGRQGAWGVGAGRIGGRGPGGRGLWAWG